MSNPRLPSRLGSTSLTPTRTERTVGRELERVRGREAIDTERQLARIRLIEAVAEEATLATGHLTESIANRTVVRCLADLEQAINATDRARLDSGASTGPPHEALPQRQGWAEELIVAELSRAEHPLYPKERIDHLAACAGRAASMPVPYGFTGIGARPAGPATPLASTATLAGFELGGIKTIETGWPSTLYEAVLASRGAFHVPFVTSATRFEPAGVAVDANGVAGPVGAPLSDTAN